MHGAIAANLAEHRTCDEVVSQHMGMRVSAASGIHAGVSVLVPVGSTRCRLQSRLSTPVERYVRDMLPDLDAWDAWPPSAMSIRLAGLTAPWCVAAGLALDLFLGRSTRVHGDLEIAIPAASFAEVATRFEDCDFFVPRSGVLFALDDPRLRDPDSATSIPTGSGLPGSDLASSDLGSSNLAGAYPASSETFIAGHQTWARERATGKWRFDVFREPHNADVWIYRRDMRVRRPYAELIERTADGIPFLVPEIVLLFKAKNPRSKDEADFAAVLPSLRAGQRQWLDAALALAYPDHPWRADLAASTRP